MLDNIFNVINWDYTNAIMKKSEILPTSKPESVLVTQLIQPLLSYNGLRQLYEEQTGYWDSNIASRLGFVNKITSASKPRWIYDITVSPVGTAGAFTSSFDRAVLDVGTLIKFKNVDTGEVTWTSVISYNTETEQYILSKAIQTNNEVQCYYPVLRRTFNSSEITLISNQLSKKIDFGLWYDLDTLTWKVSENTTTFDFDLDFNIQSNYCLVKVEYTGNSWNFLSRGVDYVFDGGDRVKFYFVNESKLSDISTGTSKIDYIKVVRGNYDPNSSSCYSSDIEFIIDDVYKHSNGLVDYNRVKIKSMDRDLYDIPNNPTIYKSLVPSSVSEEIDLFWVTNSNNEESLISLPDSSFFVYDPNYTLSTYTNQYYKYRTTPTYRNTIDNSRAKGTVFYYVPLGIFIEYQVDRVVGNTSTNYGVAVLDAAIMNSTNQTTYLSGLGLKVVTNYRTTLGRTGLYYQWKHYAAEDRRIDPAITNINDIYVLTSSYYSDIQYWAKSSYSSTIPKAPTTAELKVTFAELDSIKAMSDTIVWNSGRFVPIFGSNSSSEYQCTFRVIKSLSSTLSDDEVKQKVISAINTYFDIDNWDFGETFYFTELSTYIHQQLATEISSVVIVPKTSASKFGTLFEISCSPQELLISTAKVDDVEIITSLTASNLKIGR